MIKKNYVTMKDILGALKELFQGLGMAILLGSGISVCLLAVGFLFEKMNIFPNRVVLCAIILSTWTLCFLYWWKKEKDMRQQDRVKKVAAVG